MCAVRVLVAEDDSCLRTSIERMLRRIYSKSNIFWATTAEEAEKMMRVMKFDLSIVDYQLAGEMNGMDLIEKIRKVNPYGTVIMMSGLPIRNFLEVMDRDQNFIPFLPKPFSLHEFSNVVQSHFKR